MSFYKNKKVLVTGGTGLIGQPLVKMLVNAGADLTVVSLDDPSKSPAGVKFVRCDLREFSECLKVCDGMQIVFQLAGVKGSPAMTSKKPASFFVPTLQFSINMMEAARRCGIERFLFTSSVGVYEPADVFYEDSVWKTFPSSNDRFAGWAKRMGELQAEAYKIEYNWDKISIVRPANVYGPFDNFDPANAMVIPSLIARAASGEKPLSVWGDGSPIRDFIFADDVAKGMLIAVEQGINEPLNLGSGTGVTIKQVAEQVAKAFNTTIEWDVTKPKGDAKRLMDTKRSESYGIKAQVSLEQGIMSTVEWYLKNILTANSGRYNSFTEFSKGHNQK
jgi:GDP-L-fucose synthase